MAGHLTSFFRTRARFALWIGWSAAAYITRTATSSSAVNNCSVVGRSADAMGRNLLSVHDALALQALRKEVLNDVPLALVIVPG